MKLGDLLCKIGIHDFEPATVMIEKEGWYSIFNGAYITHYECARCKEKKPLSTIEWDGTDNA